MRQPIVYYLEDLAGEEIDGFFYGEELCKVRKNLSTDIFEIEKILKSRGKGSSKEHFVKWKGYPNKFNSWIKVRQLVKKLRTMKDEFYIVLPSNSCMNYYSENTTSHFITQLPQQMSSRFMVSCTYGGSISADVSTRVIRIVG